MRRPQPSTVLGLVLLVTAGALAPRAVSDGTTHDRSAGSMQRAAAAPLARALEPLGPAKAVLSALLWERLQLQRRTGEIESAVPLARALLTLHPGLQAVREHLATQLILSDASRAPDPPRYRALVMAGLSLLEAGQAIEESPELHGALGQLLAIQGRNDARFWEVAGEYFGAAPEDIAIQELRQAGGRPLGSLLLADLLLDRGFAAWDADGDSYAADRDLSEAQQLVQSPPADATGFAEERRMLAGRIAELRVQIAEQGNSP